MIVLFSGRWKKGGTPELWDGKDIRTDYRTFGGYFFASYPEDIVWVITAYEPHRTQWNDSLTERR